MSTYFLQNFDPHAIAASGQCFRMWETAPRRVEAIVKERYIAITSLEDHLFEFSCSDDEYQTIWRPYFDIDTDYGAFIRSVDENDGYLLKAAEQGSGLRILRQDPWEVLISFILSQRKSIPAIQDAVEKLCLHFGKPLPLHGRELYSFPSPQALADAPMAHLMACSVGYRGPYIQAAARAIATGEIDLGAFSSLSDDALLARLLMLYGVGIKVANCTLLFGYHRLSAAPVDVWIQRIIDSEYGGAAPFERYPGFAGVMQQYMFYEQMLKKRTQPRLKGA